jgi:serine/threonine protein kinase/Tfp pilus assembly protein PilF
MTDFLEQLQEGLRGRYSIERELGAGGMAVVFLAQDERHGRSVALKVLRPELASEIGADRFLREIRIAAGLTHPHILPLHDSGKAESFLFYVMPNMEGQSLRERMDREQQLSLDEAIRITQEVASALDYAHRQGVVHRDIKPENILLHEGAALVADFGIGKAVSSADGPITQTGIVVGTPTYMSPEQASAEHEVDGRSDLYSLGCVLYEMLTGEPPYTGPNAQAIIAKRFITPIPKVRVMRDVPEQVDQAVTRALAKTPVDRFASGAEFADALRLIQSGTTTPQKGMAASGDPGPSRGSIAVVPLTNMSADPENEYFADGMTEEIINVLGKLKELQVASRVTSFAFKGKALDVDEIGKKIGVGTVLSGSVRKAGNRIRIAAELIDVSNGYHIWSETYDRQLEDVFAIQDEISHAIADALKVELVGEAAPLVVPTTEDLEAYTLYLKGRFFFNKFTENGLRQSLELYAQALEKDPSYARAHAGAAHTWMNLADDWLPPNDAYPKAKEAAQRALAIEPDLVEARTALGKALGWYDWDFERAEQELRKVIAVEAKSAEAHYALASILPAMGRGEAAVAAMRRACALDPLSAEYARWLARLLVFTGDYDEGIAQSRRTLELDASYWRVYLDLGNAYLAQGFPEKALSVYQQGQVIDGSVISFNASTPRALAAMGQEDEVRRTLTELEELSSQRYIRAEIIAAGYAALGEIDQAFHWLETALEARSAGLIYLAVEPAYAAIRSDPRFGSLVERIGLKT